MNQLSTIQNIAILALPVLFAITVHEAAHGWVALRLGDRTAQMLGRVTVNPIKHIDPLGTVILPLIMYMTTGFLFGWAKPVPITWENLKNPKRDIALVALAGPTANLIMAILWALLIALAASLPQSMSWWTTPMIYMGQAGIFINVVLLVLNLLPLPPLDGGRILTSVLPGPLSWRVSRIEPYGIFILLGILFLGGWKYMFQVVQFINNLIYELFL